MPDLLDVESGYAVKFDELDEQHAARATHLSPRIRKTTRLISDPLDHAEVDLLPPQFPAEKQEQSMVETPNSLSSLSVYKRLNPR